MLIYLVSPAKQSVPGGHRLEANSPGGHKLEANSAGGEKYAKYL